LLSGLFAIVYAFNGVTRRGRFWKTYFFPVLIVQFLIMGLLTNWFPDLPHPAQWNAAETGRLQMRLILDGAAIITCVVLGYSGFIHVSISEGRRYIKIQTEKATLDAEMAAAREVQRVMVPEHLPVIRGYALESVYLPAAEVGGDFFQVIPLKSGSTLIVIGDVSGKGLRAAMIVSMIIGMLCTLTGFTEEPAEILAELNRRLCGRAQDGFATCIVIRLETEGRLTLANAGHPPPYLNGKEVPFAGSMPLGLVETANFTQKCVEIRDGDRAILLTDGIPEARNQEGVLLGFPQVESLLRDGATARTLAEAAKHHGQNDDLTVIGIARQA
jgi:serine phosphatase RsbU (regulator of sigma subunit)